MWLRCVPLVVRSAVAEIGVLGTAAPWWFGRAGVAVTDIRESVDGSTTVRLAGLDAKERSLGSLRFELEGIVADGVSAVADAVEHWRGRHAETFVEEVNPFLRRLARLVQKVGEGKGAVAAWPEVAVRDPLEERAVDSAAVEVPASAGTSAAYPAKLDVLADWCSSVHERVPSLAAAVGLDGVTAEVTRPQRGLDLMTPQGSWANEPWSTGQWPNEPWRPSVLVEPEPVLETVSRDPALYVHVPDVSELVAVIIGGAGHLGAFTAAVALAFRREDERLLELVLAHPGLADELLAGWEDGQIGAESSLVIVLAYFDVFDSATTGDEDGLISLDDLAEIAGSTDVPRYVREAAAYLSGNPELFRLIETVNDTTQPPVTDQFGQHTGDGRMSRQDVELFLELNDHLRVIDEHFTTFDSAAHPDRPPDGSIDLADLDALAGGDDAVAATATWLLANGPLYDRVARYQTGGGSDTAPITIDSLVALSVDQQVHADSPPAAAAFVERRLDTLLGRSMGDAATGEGMYALFDTALTTSDQREELMGQVIDKVAEDGEIHNPGLPLAYANGTAANMDTIHSRINDDFDLDGADRAFFQDTHAFLRETMRDTDAAEVVTGAARDYFGRRLDLLPSGAGREFHLNETGRTIGVITQAQANAVIAEARRSPDAAQAQAGSLNFLVGLIPYVGELNDLAGIGGTSLGNLVSDASDDTAADAAARAYLDELDEVGAVTMTTHHYNDGMIDPHDAVVSMRDYLERLDDDSVSLTEAEVERIFFNWDGTPREHLPLRGMSEEQRTAFGQWAISTGVGRTAVDESATPLQNDVTRLRDGFRDVEPLTNQHGVG